MNAKQETKALQDYESKIVALSNRFPKHLREDLQQEGRLALVKALRRLEAEPLRVAKFWTYARPAVLGAMTDYFDATKGEDTDEFEDTVSDRGLSPEQNCQVSEFLDRLTAPEAEVFRGRIEGRSREDIGRTSGRSSTGITRIWKTAVGAS